MGCGACVNACPNNAVSITDIVDKGIRPQIDQDKCQHCGECINICPGVGLSHEPFSEDTIEELRAVWGPVLEVWEGHAADDHIRFMGSSGGAATAIALYCLEKENFSGTLHIGPKEDQPLTNNSVFSKTRDELLSRTGSRYSPAAACRRFEWITNAEGKSVFIGKPCDIAALRKAQKTNPELNEKVGLTISIFCAGTPNTQGTHSVLKAMGIDEPDEVEKFRYRGQGWPGNAVANIKGSDKEYSMTYAQAWGDILSRHGQLRCRLCADSSGEFADISCGDPWYKDIEPDEPGLSLVMARTPRGAEFIKKCIDAGYLKLATAKPHIVGDSQKSMHQRRCQIWGRLLAFKLLGTPSPDYKGMSLYSNWKTLSIKAKIHSVLSTIKRIVMRKLYNPENLSSKKSRN